MNPETGLCRGCWRTLDEIARWGTMDEAERARVSAALPARRAAGEAPPATTGRSAP
jgi:predicted Fe-S protein YdhL (DUF1289 family)